MIAMIFAAGLGTRLRPLTDFCPKALIEVGGKTMLERVMTRLSEAGVTRVVINVHHHADMIRDYLSVNSNFGLDVAVSDESERLMDTGGGVARAAQLLDVNEPVLLHNADILTDFDIKEMITSHEVSNADVTLLADTRSTSRYLLFDKNRRMTGWCNILNGELRTPYTTDRVKEDLPLAFGGVHIIDPAVLKDLARYAPGDKFSITTFYIDRCDIFDIQAYTPSCPYRWIDIGKPASLEEARAMFPL